MTDLYTLGITPEQDFWEIFHNEVDLDTLPSVIRHQYLQDPIAGLQMERDHRELVARENAACRALSTEEQAAQQKKFTDFLFSHS